MLLLVATIPTGIVGLLMKHYVEQTKTNPVFVGSMEIVTGLYLALSYFRRGGRKDRDTMTYLDAFIIGTVQGFAVLPGLSRSASTIGFGLLLGFVGRWAADYTFLLAIPAIVGAAGVEILSALRHQGPGFFATPDFARYLRRGGGRGHRGLHDDRFPHPDGLHPEGPLVRGLLLRVRPRPHLRVSEGRRAAARGARASRIAP